MLADLQIFIWTFSLLLAKAAVSFFYMPPLESLRSSLAWSLPGPHHQGQIFFIFICQFAKMSLWLSVRKVLIPLQTLWFKSHLKEQGTLQKAGRCVSVCISFIPKWDFQTVLPYELLRSQKSILSVKRRSYHRSSYCEEQMGQRIWKKVQITGQYNVKYHFFLCKMGISGV